MTSKRLFSKYINMAREDLRHKIWMISLSALICFLAMPMAWLIKENNMPSAREVGMVLKDDIVNEIMEMFHVYLLMMGGVITVLGAVITGLAGFRFLFHKNMVDTYHSMPVSRKTYFMVCYLEGIFIWFAPFAVSLLLMVVMAGRYMARIGGGRGKVMELAGAAVSGMVVLLVVFLLVYNLVLNAAMLSGNILNALVSMVILGFGVICFTAIMEGFCEAYLHTFYESSVSILGITVYLSPLFSVIILILRCVDEGMIAGALIFNLLAAALLGLSAWFLYRNRESELAEQGIRNRTAAAFMKIITGMVAGICGWQFFVVLVNNNLNVWGCAGLILSVIFTMGVLEIIFQMDFKAFFAHKLQMAATVVVTLLICYALCEDWFGFDVYLPAANEIARLGLCADSALHNYNINSVLDNMSLTDQEAIYAYLERMTAREGNDYNVAGWRRHAFIAKVTLKNGRSYYRSYTAWDTDKDVVVPLLASEEYVRHVYCIDEEAAKDCFSVSFRRNGDYSDRNFRSEDIAEIVRAYNEDVLENPYAAVLGEGRLLVKMILQCSNKEGEIYFVYMEIYDSMERAVEAVQQAGRGKWVEIDDADDIAAIGLTVGNAEDRNVPAQDAVILAREKYGAYEEWAYDREVVEGIELSSYVPGNAVLLIRDKEEVKELLQYISYAAPGANTFTEDYVELWIEGVDGSRETRYIRKGLLPEKYILRFGSEQ